jgi:integrase
MASSRIITDTLDEVVEGSVWVHRQMLAKGESPYWYTRIKLPEYIESRNSKAQYIRRSTKKRSQQEATQWAIDLFHEMCGNQKLGMPTESRTFSWVFADYQRLQKRGVDAGEVSTNRYQLNESTYQNYFSSFFGEMDISKVNSETILEYKAKRNTQMGLAGGASVRKRTKPSAHTINVENMVLRDILKHAHDKKYIHNIPTIKNNYSQRVPHLDFSADEWAYILKKFDEDIAKSRQQKMVVHEWRYKLMLKTLCQLLVYSGARVGGETNQSLLWDDLRAVEKISGKEKQHHIGTHTECPYDKREIIRVEVLIRNVKYRTKPNPRLVMAIPYLEPALRAWRSASDFVSTGDFVFCHQGDGMNGKPSTPIKSFKNGFERFMKRHTNEEFLLWKDAESPHRTLYSCRHVYATQRLINGDIGVYELSRNMGTSIRELERTYAKALPQSFAKQLTGGLR